MTLWFRILLAITLTILSSQLVRSQNPSPCPRVFSYEPKGTESDRWYGVILLQSEDDLSGIYVRVILDRPAELLGNWFGDATSSDNTEYLIKNPKYHLEAGPPVSLRLFVKYNAAATIPSVKSITLNGKNICQNKQSVEGSTSGGTLHISQNKPDTGRPSNNNNNRPKPSSSSSGSTLVNSNNNGGNTRPSNQDFGNSQSNGKPSSSTSTQSNGRPSNQDFGNSQTNGRPSSTSTQSNGRPSNQDFGNSQSNGRPSSTNTQRPSNQDFGNSQSNGRPSSSTNTQRPNNAQDFDNSQSSRPFRPSNTDNDNFGSNSQTQRPFRPAAVTEDDDYDSPNIDNNNNNRPNSNNQEGLTFGANSGDSSEFFPGDFAQERPSLNRPTASRPTSLHSNNVKCGTVAMRPSPLISHGQNTTQGQFPWHAALYHSQGIQLRYTCGGTLVSENHVITAAHCVTKPQTNRAINPQNILVYLGKYDLRKFGPEVQDRGVSDIHVHPHYNYSFYFNDVAILRLERAVEITTYVRPCCLWEEGPDLEDILNRLGTVVGWGFDENRQLTNSLMQAQMPIVSTVKCIYSNREFFSQFTFEKNYCAGFKNGTAVCNGDSGGGMVLPKSGTSGANTIWQLRGLVSVGVALQGQGVCDPSHYIVFTDIAKHLDWIAQTMND